MNDIPKLVPIPQSEIDALAASVGICERIAAEFNSTEGVDEMNQPINRCGRCGCSFTYDPASHRCLRELMDAELQRVRGGA